MDKSSENLPGNQQNKTTVYTNISNYFKEYCGRTSIHGFQYFGESRSIFEKLWWFVVYCFILSGCSYMIYKIYEKYDTSPVLVTFSTKETPVYKIPFPAVTVCPETKSLKRKFDFTKTMKKKMANLPLTREENKYLQYMSLLCDADDDITEDDYDAALNSEFTNETFRAEDIFAALDEVKPVIDDEYDVIISCQYLGENCDDLIVPVMTDEGVCYSFNILNRSEIFEDIVKHHGYYHMLDDKYYGSWDLENGYTKEMGDHYPQRSLVAGAANGLTLRMATRGEDLDYICKQIQGFKVVLHAPFRIPRLKLEYFRVPLDQSVVAAVQPVMITTSEKVKTFDVKKRDCYFKTERKLKYFRYYSQQNCQLECITNITLEECNCVKIFMPREAGTEICGPAKENCTAEAASGLMGVEFLRTFAEYSPDVTEFFEEVEEYCKCLPLCTDISYRMETSQTGWDWEEKFHLTNKKYFDKATIHLSSLTVYFKFNHFITSERQELYGPTDFVANFGGLLGLFTGFSILSLMEIVYFLTVRICCNIRLYGRWNGADE